MSLNRAQIIGNATRDPEVRQTTGGQSVCSFGVATNRVWKDSSGNRQEETEFHNVVAWGRLAEICGQYLGKGRKVFVEGRLKTREWETQDGQKRRTTEIIAENMVLLDRPGSGAGAATGKMGGGNDPFRAPPTSAPTQDIEPASSEEEIKLEDIPF